MDTDAEMTGFSDFYRADGWLSSSKDIPDDDAIVTGCASTEELLFVYLHIYNVLSCSF